MQDLERRAAPRFKGSAGGAAKSCLGSYAHVSRRLVWLRQMKAATGGAAPAKTRALSCCSPGACAHMHAQLALHLQAGAALHWPARLALDVRLELEFVARNSFETST